MQERKDYLVIVTESGISAKNPRKEFIVSSPNLKNAMDIYNLTRTYQNYLKKIKSLDQPLILKFLKFTESQGISLVQRLKYCISLLQFFSIIKKPIKEINEEDLYEFLASINGKPKTRKLRYYCVKKFLEFAGRDDLFVHFKPRFIIRQKLPEILSEKEIEEISCMLNFRERVIFCILYESGARIGEFLKIRKKDVSFDEKGAVIILKGKTGERRIRIIKYAKLLRLWLDMCGDLVFPFKYSQIRRLFEKISRLANRKIHPHLLRHSRATHLAKYLTESQLKAFFGWSQASRMASIYVHLSGRDIDEKLIEIYERKKLDII